MTGFAKLFPRFVVLAVSISCIANITASVIIATFLKPNKHTKRGLNRIVWPSITSSRLGVHIKAQKPPQQPCKHMTSENPVAPQHSTSCPESPWSTEKD